MNISELISKVKCKLWYKLLSYFRDTKLHPYLYRSYWHSMFHRNNTKNNTTCYYAANPNQGAGIGHQMANWIAGYWYAKQFGLKFAHLPFSTQKWENFLGFGEGEMRVDELVKKNGFKKRKLPMFNENDDVEIEMNRAIIQSYSGQKVVFIAEQDQSYSDQYGVMENCQQKFGNAVSRKNDDIIYDKNCFNIAVHVRRTVIIGSKVIEENDEVKAMRWLDNDYYETVLKLVLKNIKVNKPICIYIFSTGKPEEFAEFSQYGNVRFCSDMDEYKSFAHLIFADLLITSKSSFSYKPALMNKGIKICPRNFWHGYPDTKDWLLAENDGTFDVTRLDKVLS